MTEISLFEVCKGSGCNGIGSPAGKEQRVDEVRSNGQEAGPTAKEPQLEARFADTMGIGEIAGLSVGGRWHPKTADRIGSSKHRHRVPACLQSGRNSLSKHERWICMAMSVKCKWLLAGGGGADGSGIMIGEVGIACEEEE